MKLFYQLDKVGATSLLFRKWSPVVEELYLAPVTASAAAADASKKINVKKATGN